MREIKFRAWDKKNKEWIANGDAMDLYHSASSNCFLFDNDNYDLNDDIEFVQYTGLKDKNGKEIYEGDIVKYTKHKSYLLGDFIGEVRWYKTGCWDFFTSEGYPRIGIQTAHELERDILSHIEIIGNIYENPELLSPK